MPSRASHSRAAAVEKQDGTGISLDGSLKEFTQAGENDAQWLPLVDQSAGHGTDFADAETHGSFCRVLFVTHLPICLQISPASAVTFAGTPETDGRTPFPARPLPRQSAVALRIIEGSPLYITVDCTAYSRGAHCELLGGRLWNLISKIGKATLK